MPHSYIISIVHSSIYPLTHPDRLLLLAAHGVLGRLRQVLVEHLRGAEDELVLFL